MSAEFVELGVMGSRAIGWKTVMRHARVCNPEIGGEVVDRWTKRAGERPTMESATLGVGPSQHSRLRGVTSIVDVDIRRTRLTDTLDHSITIDFNHHDLVHNNAIFTTPALCSRDLYSRKTFSRVKVRQALTSSLVAHLTDSTTLTAYLVAPHQAFRKLSRSLQVEGPVIIMPDTLLSSRGFKDTSTLN